MRFGVCASLAQAEAVMAAGYDYVELPAVSFVDPGFDLAAAEGIPTPCTNVFFPGSLRLYEEDWRPHARQVLDVAARLQVETMVVGSGAARRAPAGMSAAEAEGRFADLVAELQEMARPAGIAIAPESLERGETDVYNSLARLARDLRARELAYTADSFHVLKEWNAEGQPVALDLLMEEEVPHLPRHVHLGDLPRNPPEADDPMVVAFASRLRALGYDGTVSLECRWQSFEVQLGPARSALHALFSSS